MDTIKVHNTLTRSIEDFISQESDQVKIYHCGPTVYWTQHIGNLRAIYFGDIVRRTLKHAGYNPVYVRNYTDVGHLDGDNNGDADSGEDRMEKGAKREGITVWDIAQKYINQFDSDIEKLGVLKADFSPRATDNIQDQIQMIKILLEKNYAYITDEAVYFDVSKAKNYTRLTNQNLDENISGAGHGSSEILYKRNPEDFALWFFRTGHYKNHSMHWNSPFISEQNSTGDGFPGWHIECSAMAKKYLGNTLDIHIGGVEHIPVHHTNEIAQSENANDENFVNYWLHYEHLLIDGKKMSKSLGNTYILSDLEEKGFNGMDLRYFFLNAHYRSQQNFTFDALKDARNARLKLLEKIENLSKTSEAELYLNLETKKDQSNYKKQYRNQFNEYIYNDFNTSGALATVWNMLKDPQLDNDSKITLFEEWNNILRIEHDPKDKKSIDEKLLKQITNLVHQRNLAKSQKDFIKADEIRDNLIGLGVEIKDTSKGTEWSLK